MRNRASYGSAETSAAMLHPAGAKQDKSHRRPSKLRSRPVSRPLPGSAGDVLAGMENMSRRIRDLARELNCLGHFDDENGDLPRAA